MRIPHAALPLARSLVLLVFVGSCLTVLGYLWVNSGGRLPLISQTGYRVTVLLPDADNLVQESDVKRAGVDIGRVARIKADGDRAVTTIQLDPDQAPLHQGVTVTVHNKTLIEETYLSVTDGSGPALPAGSTLPDGAGRGSVQLDDVLASLDEGTRRSLGSLLRGSGLATKQRREDISNAMSGLGDIGRQGTVALTALAAQSEDIQRLMVHSTTLFDALDTQQGRVASLVTDAERVFRSTAEHRRDIEGLVRLLPPLLGTARDASASLDTLAQSLRPIASDLRTAAPDLREALRELPATSSDLRGLVPALQTTLNRVPDTLHRVPRFSDDLRELIPTLRVNLADLNPALAFLAPYSRDVAAFFTNFSASVGPDDGNGKIFRILFLFNEQTANSPANSNVGPLDKRNAIPEPGTGADPNPHGDSQRSYPRIEEEPVPR